MLSDSQATPVTGSPRRPVFDFSPLRHPLWWFALTLLLVNDNLLKGHVISPIWLTGKLSDVAFVVVAPVLLTCLLPSRWRHRRGVAFALVASGFTACNLSPSMSDALVAVLARAGLHWRLWPDATDLVALLALPLGWRIASGNPRLPAHSARQLAQATGMAVGVLACLATGSAGGGMHYPFLLNRTVAPRTMSIAWLLRKTDCNVDLQALASSLGQGDLDAAHVVTLSSGQVTALDAPPDGQTSPVGVCQNLSPHSGEWDDRCMTAVVSVDGGPAVVVSARRYWDTSDPEAWPGCSHGNDSTSTCAAGMSIVVDPGSDALSLVESGGQLRFQAGANVRMADVDLAAVAARSTPGCRELRDQIENALDATACSVDADCQVAHVNIAIPAAGVCDVYVNRQVSSAQIAQWRTQWTQQCVVDGHFACGNGFAQPAVCNAGKCGPMCPGVYVPGCPDTCASLGQAIGERCSQASSRPCLSPDRLRCTCTGSEPLLVCQPQEQIPGCPITCTSTVPLGAVGALSDAGVDAPSDAALDSAMDASTRAPVDAVGTLDAE
jgi:hypothetical protein